MSTSKNLSSGDLVLLIDNKKRQYTITLTEGEEFHTHTGMVPHTAIIGLCEGSEVATERGQKFKVFRPSMSDFIISMPRGAQVIYPKDIGAMLMLADIAPGVEVFESGLGSGALSMSVLRLGAHITGYEIREDFASRAQKNVSKFLGPEALQRYNVEIRDAYEGVDQSNFDRALLDIPEPWRVIPHLATALRRGGTIVSYSPSILQVAQVDEVLKKNGFSEISVTEVLHRTWHVKDAAVRPDHKMVGHTGFLTRARLLEA